MLETLTSVSLLTAAAIVGPIILGLVLLYGSVRTARRTPSEKAVTEKATAKLYAREDRIEKERSPS
jgi:hypothetical protein